MWGGRVAPHFSISVLLFFFRSKKNMSYDTESKINTLGATFATVYYRYLLDGNADAITAMHAPSADVATSVASGVTLRNVSGEPLGSYRNSNAPGTAPGAEVQRRVDLIRDTLLSLENPHINVVTVDAVRTDKGVVLVNITSQLGGVYAVVHAAVLATVGQNAYVIGDTMRILPAAVSQAVVSPVSIKVFIVEPPPPPTPPPAPVPVVTTTTVEESSSGVRESSGGRERRSKGDRGERRRADRDQSSRANDNNAESNNAPRGGSRGARGQNNNNNNQQRYNEKEDNPDATLLLTRFPSDARLSRQSVFSLAKPHGWVDYVEIDYDRNEAKVVFTDPEGATRMIRTAKKDGVYVGDQRLRVDYYY